MGRTGGGVWEYLALMDDGHGTPFDVDIHEASAYTGMSVQTVLKSMNRYRENGNITKESVGQGKHRIQLLHTPGAQPGARKHKKRKHPATPNTQAGTFPGIERLSEAAEQVRAAGGQVTFGGIQAEAIALLSAYKREAQTRKDIEQQLRSEIEAKERCLRDTQRLQAELAQRSGAMVTYGER